MQDLIDAHRTELAEAMEAHSIDMLAAQQKYLDAVQASRERLTAAMMERLSVWNGELPKTLPPAPALEKEIATAVGVVWAGSIESSEGIMP